MRIVIPTRRIRKAQQLISSGDFRGSTCCPENSTFLPRPCFGQPLETGARQDREFAVGKFPR